MALPLHPFIPESQPFIPIPLEFSTSCKKPWLNVLAESTNCATDRGSTISQAYSTNDDFQKTIRRQSCSASNWCARVWPPHPGLGRKPWRLDFFLLRRDCHGLPTLSSLSQSRATADHCWHGVYSASFLCPPHTFCVSAVASISDSAQQLGSTLHAASGLRSRVYTGAHFIKSGHTLRLLGSGLSGVEFSDLEFTSACVQGALGSAPGYVFFQRLRRHYQRLHAYCFGRVGGGLLPPLPRRRASRHAARSALGKSASPDLEEPTAAALPFQYHALDFSPDADRRAGRRPHDL